MGAELAGFALLLLLPFLGAVAMPNWRWLVRFVLVAGAFLSYNGLADRDEPCGMISLMSLPAWQETWHALFVSLVLGCVARCLTLRLSALKSGCRTLWSAHSLLLLLAPFGFMAIGAAARMLHIDLCWDGAMPK